MHCTELQCKYIFDEVKEGNESREPTYAKVDLVLLLAGLSTFRVIDASICQPRDGVVVPIDLRCEWPTDKVLRVAVPDCGVE